ncbi:hypothetical protein [Rhizobium rhizogenes]|uniref:hypothetical protein n=1 Tax=Rhizobium rhizogenes TaxID=359 RepID=UPI001572482E|nr:hypothetical protein [Rhizobium rhizogenes]NTG41675.1 hypothetical protein [Rhizobium rhizogenes]
MADSDNSRSLPIVTRRRLLSASAAWLTLQVGTADAALLGNDREQGMNADPVLALWQGWTTAYSEMEHLCRVQQRLESQMMKTVGFPSVEIVAGDGEHSVMAFSMEEIDYQLGGRPEFEAAKAQAKAILTERQTAWDALGEHLGYNHAKRGEEAACARQNGLAIALWTEPARSIAGATAKLHAILSVGQGSHDEFPWPQIRAVITDLLTMGDVHSVPELFPKR